jgi:Flp pilus assembly protein TadB
MIIVAVALGALAGLGIWLVARGLAAPPQPLAAALADLERPRWRDDSRQPVGMGSRARVWATRLALLAGVSDVTEQRLSLVERSTERHAIDKLVYAAMGAGLPVLGWTIMAFGGVQVVPLLAAALTTAFALAGFFLPDMMLRAEAARYRRDFIGQLAVYLNLVVVLLAGGRGVEGALVAASSVGDSSAFVRIRRAVTTAQLNRESPWRALERLAQQIDVVPLAELAASVTLAGETGARVRDSLTAKAVAIRSRLLAEAETEAHRRSETMTGPVVLMLTGFIILIGFPAVHTLLTV